MITIKQRGNFEKTEKFLKYSTSIKYLAIFQKYGKLGVDALSKATPIDSGETARSWKYHIDRSGLGTSLVWTNSHLDNGVPIAIIIQFGHATRNGGFVHGKDYINPALRPIFDAISKAIWKEVTSL